MLRMVHWDEELGVYSTSVKNLVNEQDLINYIGLLEDKIEELEKEIKGE